MSLLSDETITTFCTHPSDLVKELADLRAERDEWKRIAEKRYEVVALMMEHFDPLVQVFWKMRSALKNPEDRNYA